MVNKEPSDYYIDAYFSIDAMRQRDSLGTDPPEQYALDCHVLKGYIRRSCCSRDRRYDKEQTAAHQLGA